jgi:hypothetical protein
MNINEYEKLSNITLVVMSLHSDTLSWFWVNQVLLFLLNAACLVEKQQIIILCSFVWPDLGLEHNIYRSRGEYANDYTTDAVPSVCLIRQIKNTMVTY